MAAQAVRWAGISKVACSRLTRCSKSCDLQTAFASCNTGSSVSTALCRVGVTAKLYLQSLTALPVVGCGRLQLGAPQWATLVALLQVVDN